VEQVFPTITGTVDPAVDLTIRTLIAKARAQAAMIASLTPRVAALSAQPAPLTIADIKAQLELGGGGSSLDVTGLVGVLGQPQLPGVPLLADFPSADGASDGLLINVNGVLYYFDASSSEPGQWVPLTANAAVIIDTHANRLAHYAAASQPVGELFFESDRDAFYAIEVIGGVNTWVFLLCRPMKDVLANRPADLGAHDAGFTFWASDVPRVDYWNGAAWSAVPWTVITVPYQKAVAGAAPGDVTVTGINVGDTLVSVIFFPGAGLAVTDVIDLTSEFTITALNTINNGGGTDTSGGKLLVMWTA